MRGQNILSPSELAYQIIKDALPDVKAIRHLRNLGVNTDLVTDVCGPIITRKLRWVEESAEPAWLGDDAYVHAVCGRAGVEDILVWSAAHPSTFCTLFGRAALYHPSSDWQSTDPLYLWPTPLELLQANCLGATIIDANRAAPILKQHPGRLAVPSLEHARDLVADGIPSSKFIILKQAEAA
ncbi:MAG: hypothetical protein U1E46_07000 [Hyphomicrobiales bacterium]